MRRACRHSVFVFATLVAAAALSAAAGDWCVHRGDMAQTGCVAKAPPDTLRLLWRARLGKPIASTPAVVDGVLYVGCDDGFVYALDVAQRGRRKWTFQTQDPVSAAPLVVDKTVYVGSGDENLYALDAATGAKRWAYKTGGKIAGGATAATIGEGESAVPVVLVGSFDSKLHCVRAADGKGLWQYEADSYVNGTPAITDGRVVFGGCDGKLRVLNLADGKELRAVALGDSVPVTPAMHAGKELPEAPAGSFIPGTPAIRDGKIYAATFDGALSRVDLKTGKIDWTYQVPPPTKDAMPPAFFSSPAVGEKLVVLGDEGGSLHAVNVADGKQLWEFRAGGAINLGAVLAGDRVVVGSEDGRVYLLNAETGAKVWSWRLGRAVGSGPVVAGGMVLAGGADGWVYAFGGPKETE